MTDDFSFPPELRVRHAADYRRAMRNRISVSDDLLVVYGWPNELPHARLGLIVSRKVGNAVERHHWKRMLREAFRLSQAELPRGIDLIVLPRLGRQPELVALRESLVRLAARLGRRMRKERTQ